MDQKSSLSISVIIITLNRADWLNEALASLVEQTRKPDEIIVVDNGSNDHTENVVQSYTGKLNLKFVKEKTRGIPYARNAGVKNAKGDILAFIDDDCVADREWMKYLEIPFIRDPKIGVVGGEVAYLKGDEGIVDKFYRQNMPSFEDVIK